MDFPLYPEASFDLYSRSDSVDMSMLEFRFTSLAPSTPDLSASPKLAATLNDTFYPSPPLMEQSFSRPFNPQNPVDMFNMVNMDSDSYAMPFLLDPAGFNEVNPFSPPMDWSLLSPLAMDSDSGPVRRRRSNSSICSSGSNRSSTSSMSATSAESAELKEKIQCPQPGCFSTFSKIKYLKRHAQKHKIHSLACPNATCKVTTYRSDMLKAHIKTCRFGPRVEN